MPSVISFASYPHMIASRITRQMKSTMKRSADLVLASVRFIFLFSELRLVAAPST